MGHADARCFVIPGITHHARNNLADTVPQAINALGTDEGDKGYSQGNRIYYRSQAFWQVSASVNLPGAANRTTDAGLNGFDSRCCAYGVAIAVLTEMKFPDTEGNATLEYPEGYTSRRSRVMYYRFVISVVLGFMPFFATANGTTASNSAMRLEANLGKGCHIAITLPDNAKGNIVGEAQSGLGGFGVDPIPKSWRYKSFPHLSFGLTCYDAEEALSRIDKASFDLKTETWTKDVDKRIRALGFEVSPQEYKNLYAEFDKAIRVYNVTAVNSKGVASTEEDTTGDERNRRRQMGFCLFHPPKALCGGGVVGYIPDGPQSDLSVKVLEILRTVEFLPDAE